MPGRHRNRCTCRALGVPMDCTIQRSYRGSWSMVSHSSKRRFMAERDRKGAMVCDRESMNSSIMTMSMRIGGARYDARPPQIRRESKTPWRRYGRKNALIAKPVLKDGLLLSFFMLR